MTVFENADVINTDRDLWEAPKTPERTLPSFAESTPFTTSSIQIVGEAPHEDAPAKPFKSSIQILDDTPSSANGGKIISLDETPSTDGGKIISLDETPSTDGGTIISLDETPSTDGGKIISLDETPSTDGGKIISFDDNPNETVFISEESQPTTPIPTLPSWLEEDSSTEEEEKAALATQVACCSTGEEGVGSNKREWREKHEEIEWKRKRLEEEEGKDEEKEGNEDEENVEGNVGARE